MLISALMVLLTAHTSLRPIGRDHEWRSLQATYRYIPIKPGDVSQSTTVENGTRTVTFIYPSQTGDTVHGLLIEPASATDAPCVVVAHGFSADKSFANVFAPTLLKNGMAVAAIDAPHHGARTTPADRKTIAGILAVFKASPPGFLPVPASKRTLPPLMLSAMHGDVLDTRRLLDYLDSRKEINHARIGLIAQSMGSMESLITLAVEPRITCGALEVGGAFGPQTYAKTAPSARPTSSGLYARYIKAPVLCLCAKHDSQMPRTATNAMLAALPKGTTTVKWYDADHWLNPTAHADAAQWVVDHLSH